VLDMTRGLRRFLKDERGAGTVFMVLMLPVFLGLAGLAIDAADAYRTRNILQGAADAASLAATLALPDTKAATAAAINYAKLNLPHNGDVLAAADVEAGNWNTITHVFTPGGTPTNSVRVITRMTAARGNALPTTLLRIIGKNSWDITAEAISVADQPKLWVALVLDNSISMNEADGMKITKLSALKKGTTNLLKTLKTASVRAGDVELSIVPFTKNVSLGTSYVDANWLNWSDFNRAPSPPAADVGPASPCPWSTDRYGNGYACQASATNDSAAATKIPSSGLICPTAEGIGFSARNSTGYRHYFNGCYDSRTLTTDHRGKPTSWTHTWTPNAKSTWTGCVMDRDQNYDALSTLPSSGVAMAYPENNPAYCSSATPKMAPLRVLATDSDVSYFTTQIDKLAAIGWTNQGIGFNFGWLSITPGMPLTPATPALPRDTERYVVLFSDGFNTINRWTASPNPEVPDLAANDRLLEACTKAKKEGVIIFTVFVDFPGGTEGDAGTLEACASDPKSDYYFGLTNSSAIITTFDKISQRIMKMRLVH
jgi:Flp pilus assembly protein TadG